MELRHYLAALRRNWTVWLGATVLGVLVATAVVSLTPPTYQASARVFVSVSPSIPNSAGFVQQRIKSYPDIAVSTSVLGPVIEQLGLDHSLRELRARVSATNPAGTSQVEITVRAPDAEQSATVANAVAERLTEVVEELETPSSGSRPVELTVTDPALTPASPVAPVPLHAVALGLVLGLFLGLAAAVLRSRLDPGLHTAEDVRAAWDADDGVEVLATRRGNRSTLTGSPAATLARRLEAAAGQRPVSVALVCPDPAEDGAARALARDVAAALRRRDLPATVVGADAAGPAGPGSRVQLSVLDPLAASHVWQGVADRGDPVVVVVPDGRVTAGDLREMRSILRAAGIRPLAVVLVPRRHAVGPAAEVPRPRPAAPAEPVTTRR